VAEEERDAAGGVRPERIDADAERGLTDEVQAPFRFVVVRERHLRACRQSPRRIRQRFDDETFGFAARRKYCRVAWKVDSGLAGELLGGVEGVEVVAILLVRAEH